MSDKIPADVMEAAQQTWDDIPVLTRVCTTGAIARAIMSERERCAEIASSMATDLRNRDGARFTASKIAAAIRTFPEGGKNA